MEATVRALTPALGAEITGFDATRPGAAERARGWLHEHGVIAIRDQTLDRPGFLEFARAFGTPDVHPIANGTAEHPEIIDVRKPAGEAASFGTGWHSDNSFFAEPSSVTLLLAEVVPPVGGDTLFASMERAWEALSAPLRTLLEPMDAVHTAADAYDPRRTGAEKYRGESAITYRWSESIRDEQVHPVVRRHPDTGRQSLYVNAMFTDRLVGLRSHESRGLLDLLYAHMALPDFGCRVRWEPGTMVLWDNRVVQHYALDDYPQYERRMARITITGEKPER